MEFYLQYCICLDSADLELVIAWRSFRVLYEQRWMHIKLTPVNSPYFPQKLTILRYRNSPSLIIKSVISFYLQVILYLYNPELLLRFRHGHVRASASAFSSHLPLFVWRNQYIYIRAFSKHNHFGANPSWWSNLNFCCSLLSWSIGSLMSSILASLHSKVPNFGKILRSGLNALYNDCLCQYKNLRGFWLPFNNLILLGYRSEARYEIYPGLGKDSTLCSTYVYQM